MIAGTLEIQMLANMARITEDMHKAKGIVGDAVGAMQKILGTIGVGFSAHALLEKINSVAEAMDKLKNASEKTGASVENLSKLQFFAGVSGSSLDGVTSALAKLSKGMSGAGDETAATSQALKFLGLSAKDAAGNLKDPSVLFGEISQKLIGYQDGAGKAAIAQALFGKAGAEMLPMLKKMAELGDIEATVTTEQAAAAEEYGLALAKLNRNKEALWNTVVSALLPSMQTFIGVLLDAAKETDSMGSAAKKLSDEKSIETWADASAIALGYLIDTMKAFGIAVNVGAKAAGAAAATAGRTEAWFLKPLAGANEAITMKDIARGWEDLKGRMSAIWGGFAEDADASAQSYQSFADKIDAAIKKRREYAAALAKFRAEEEGSGSGKGKPLNFALGDTKLIAAELKLYEGAMQSLEKQYFNLTHAGQLALIMYETEKGSLKTLLPEHKAELILMAEKIDAYNRLLAIQEQSGLLIKSLYDAQEKALAIEMDYLAANRLDADNMQFSIGLIGKTAREQELLNAARKIDLDLRQKIDSLPKDKEGEVAAGALPAMVRMQQEAEAAKLNILGLIGARQTAERDWLTGAAAAFNEYTDRATNAAEITKNVFTTAFKGLEDVVYNFLRHGISSLKDFASTAKDVLARMAAQKIVMQVVGSAGLGGVAGAASAATGGGGAISSMGTLSSLGNMFSSGANAVTGMANGVFQDIGVKLGSQWIADIGNYGFGLPIISGLMLAASGNVAAGVGSTLGGIAGSYFGGPIGSVIGSTIGAAIGDALFGGGDDRVAQVVAQYATGTISRKGLAGGGITSLLGTAPNDYWAGSQNAALPQAALSAFNASVTKIFNDMETQAKAAGISTESLAKVAVQVANSGKGAEQDLVDALAKTADTIAESLMPNLAALQQSGESLTQTFVRVTNAQIAYKAQIAATQRGLFEEILQAQGNIGQYTTMIREDVLKTLDIVSQDLQKQLWAAQDAAAATASRTAAMQAYELLAGSVSQKQLDREQALAAATDADTIVWLKAAYALQDIQAADASRTAAMQQYDIAAGTLTQQEVDRQNALAAAVDDATRTWLRMTYALQDSNRAATEAANAQAVLSAQQKQLADAAKALMQGNLSPLLTGQKLSVAQSSLQEVYQKALAKDSSAISALPSAATDYLTQLRAMYSSSSAYSAGFKMVMDMLASAGGIPGHAAGLAYVPRDDYFMRAHRGEAVLSAPQAANWRSGGVGITSADLAAMRQDNRDLRADVQRLTAVVAAGDSANVAATQSVAKAQQDIAWRQEIKPKLA